MRRLGLVILMAVIIVLFGPLVMLYQIWWSTLHETSHMGWSVAAFTLSWIVLVLIWVKAHGRYPSMPKRRLTPTKPNEESLAEVKKQVVEDSIRNLRK